MLRRTAPPSAALAVVVMDLPPDTPRYHRWDDEPPVYGNASPPSFLPFFCLCRCPTAAVVVGIVGSITGDDFLWNRPCT
jgi:hypothetical protein